MRTLEAVSISKTIIDNVEIRKEDLVKEMSKNGFVNVDGTIQQYNPMTYTFNAVNDDDLKDFINVALPNRWNVISIKQLIQYLESELPPLTEREIHNFKTYVEQYLKEINTELTETKLKKVLKEYKQYNNLEVKINDGRDITNQLIVMKQNNIFSDIKLAHFYKFKDGEFQIYNLNDILGLFNSYLANEDVIIKTSDVQRNRITYLTSLTNIRDIRVELRNKSKKESILKNYESDYKKVLKLIKGY